MRYQGLIVVCFHLVSSLLLIRTLHFGINASSHLTFLCFWDIIPLNGKDTFFIFCIFIY